MKLYEPGQKVWFPLNGMYVRGTVHSPPHNLKYLETNLVNADYTVDRDGYGSLFSFSHYELKPYESYISDPLKTQMAGAVSGAGSASLPKDIEAEVQAAKERLMQDLRDELSGRVGQQVNSGTKDLMAQDIEEVLKGWAQAQPTEHVATIKRSTERKSGPTNSGPLVCECGADKHGFASHSTWCPKC